MTTDASNHRLYDLIMNTGANERSIYLYIPNLIGRTVIVMYLSMQQLFTIVLWCDLLRIYKVGGMDAAFYALQVI